MMNIPMKSAKPLNQQNILSINQQFVQGPKTSQNIQSINHGKSSALTHRSNGQIGNPDTCPPNTCHQHPLQSSPLTPSISHKPCPVLINPIQKGQKIPLVSGEKLTNIQVRLGWNVTNPACDVDVSAFLLNHTGKVIGDSWFVFYGQEKSPDGSTVFFIDQNEDREVISVDFTKLNPHVSKIVFVLTIHEALEKHLNFSMIKDAYIRIINPISHVELVSFKMEEYYWNVTSMMIGELYQYNNIWKFSAIGNGVLRDLFGLCELYGVQVV